ncbi:hypothetical protein [Donghicola sp. XS_ASV15]|uniref:hypothetical protein n=1 Tax=Donghicola sp. XS_ASV15 TaxID=3241295 RepID=UPI0035140988
MPTTVVRAEDSAQAMDEIVARLGPDALILSTVKRNGMVEITATTDPVPPKEAVALAKEPEAESKLASAEIVPLPKTEPVQVQTRKTPPPEEAKPGFARLFKSRMNPTPEEAGEQPAPSSTSGGEGIASLMRRAQIAPAATVLRARRLILVGRVGAGKSLLALQLAAEQAQAGRDVQVSFVGASHADGAYLMSKARLLGCPMDFASADVLKSSPGANDLHIVVVSGRTSLPDDVIDAIALQDDTVTVLAMPLGMRRKTVLTSASQWRALDPVVALTATPGDALDADDVSVLIDAGLPLTWISALKSVVGALTAADRDNVTALLTEEQTAGLQSLYAQKPSKTGGVE